MIDMTPRQENIRKYIQDSIQSVCPYKDTARNRLYRIGFLEAYLACILSDDKMLFKDFKNKIEEMNHG